MSEMTEQERARLVAHQASEAELALFIEKHGGFRRFLSVLQAYCEANYFALGWAAAHQMALACFGAQALVKPTERQAVAPQPSAVERAAALAGATLVDVTNYTVSDLVKLTEAMGGYDAEFDSTAHLTIAETSTSTWNYHLRDKREPAMTALCGRAVGWDTRIPLGAWGTKSHLNEKWCAACAASVGLKGATP